MSVNSEKEMGRNINKIIVQTSSETAKTIIAELKRQGLLKTNAQNLFKKVEKLLYDYNNYLAAIEDKKNLIEAIKDEGLQKKSKSITSYREDNHIIDTSTDEEKAEEKIKTLEDSIASTQKYLAIIDAALLKISRDPYYDIITYKYFESRTLEEVAEIFEKDVSTISRNRNRLINTLKVSLFTDEAIFENFS